MSLRVKSLNADSSFLLIFSPPAAKHDPQGTFPGSFTILLDPWLSGSSTMVHRKFAHTAHTVPCCVESLDALPDPDLVIVSQDQPDHCHRETLTTLPQNTNAKILGPSSAARKVRSWKHFDASKVVSMPRYDPHTPNKSIISIPIPAYSQLGQAGEVTIALLQPKRDLTGLHNAIGITYRPPSSSMSRHNLSLLDLPATPEHSPLPGQWPIPDSGVQKHALPSLSLGQSLQPQTLTGPMTPPPTPPSVSTASVTSSGLESLSAHISAPLHLDESSLNRERSLSVIYSPHGLAYDQIKPYATTHMLMHSALPLTALFHCLDRIDNPWYLGGRVIDGGEGGVEIAKALNPQVWISAHDEDKDSSGWSVSRMKLTQMGIEDAEELLRRNSDASSNPRKVPCSTRVVEMDSGEELLLRR